MYTVCIKSTQYGNDLVFTFTHHSLTPSERLPVLHAPFMASVFYRCAICYLSCCIFIVSFQCLDTHIFTTLQHLPKVFSTVTWCTSSSLGAIGCTMQPECVVGCTTYVCVSALYDAHTKIHYLSTHFPFTLLSPVVTWCMTVWRTPHICGITAFV